jgi:nucleoside 2-deoxyribosyltransferase
VGHTPSSVNAGGKKARMQDHRARAGRTGTARHHDRSREAQVTIRVFVAMSFRHEEEPALIDYWQAMQRAARRAQGKFDLRRIDEADGGYQIIDRIYEEIQAADLVIADLTLSPANVYLELGYARGKGKHVIQTCRAGTLLEFDVRGYRTLTYRNAAALEEELLAYLNIFAASS